MFFCHLDHREKTKCILGLLLDSSQAQNDTKIHSLGSKKTAISPDSYLYLKLNSYLIRNLIKHLSASCWCLQLNTINKILF